MKKETVLAGIVTYNPNMERLKLNLDAICNQVSVVAIIDNGSKNIEKIISLTEGYDNIEVVCNASNRGIAAALNQIGDLAAAKKKEFFITLDQDSVADCSLATELYLSFFDETVGAACPYINRKNDFIANDKRKNSRIRK